MIRAIFAIAVVILVLGACSEAPLSTRAMTDEQRCANFNEVNAFRRHGEPNSIDGTDHSGFFPARC